MTKKVLWAILAKQAEKTLPFYLECLLNQDYDKKSIVLYIRTNDSTDKTEAILEEFIDTHGHLYNEVIYDNTSVDSRLSEYQNHDWNSFRFQILGKIRNISLEVSLEKNCDFYFVCDVDNFIVPNTLSSLVSLNLEIVAPMLVNARSAESRKLEIGGGDFYSNFHCAYDEIGAYVDTARYHELISRSHRGIHEVALVHCTYLVRADVIPKIDYLLHPNNYEYRNFSISAEQNGVKQCLDNRSNYGVLTLVDDVAECQKRMQFFSLDSVTKNTVFKIFNAGDSQLRNTNKNNIERMLSKQFGKLTSRTQYFQDIDHVKAFLKTHADFIIQENINYLGWKPGAIGIWASWYEAFRAFGATQNESLIIIEDDLWVVESFFTQTYLEAKNELPVDWDYLTLYTPEPQRDNFKPEDGMGFKYLSKPYGTWSNAALIFSRSGAEKLLQYMSKGINQHSDLYIFTNKENNLNGYALQPEFMLEKISVFTNWDSTIGLPRTNLLQVKDLYE